MRTCLDRLPMPWYPLIGNHDHRADFLRQLNLPPPGVAGRVCYEVETAAGRFVVLDSAIDGSHAGEIDAAQLAWLQGELARCKTDVFLFLHHHIVDSGIAVLDRIKLQNAEALYRVVAAHQPKVRHIFFGHMHRAFHGNWRGISFSTLKATAHQIHPDFSVDAKLVASSEMPSYAVVLVGPESVAIHDVSYLEETARFSYDRDAGRPVTRSS